MARCLKSLRSKLPAVNGSPTLPVTLDTLKCLNQHTGKLRADWPRRVPCSSTNHERSLIALNYCNIPDERLIFKPQRGLGCDVHLPLPMCTSPLSATTSLSCSSVRNDSTVKADSASPERKTSENEISSGPSHEQLDHVFQTLSKDLPDLFVRRLTYDIYNLDVVFENNIRGTRTVGLQNYAATISLLRLIGHIRFAYIGLDLIKITKHPEDGTVKARWRIKGLGGIRVMFLFWKYKIWKWQEMMGSHETWYDGFSTFYVGSNGKIYRHVADKVMPDNDQMEIKSTTPVTGKVALLFGLSGVPRPDLSDMICFFFGGKKRSSLLK